MKKLFSFILILSLLFSLAACAKGPDKNEYIRDCLARAKASAEAGDRDTAIGILEEGEKKYPKSQEIQSMLKKLREEPQGDPAPTEELVLEKAKEFAALYNSWFFPGYEGEAPEGAKAVSTADELKELFCAYCTEGVFEKIIPAGGAFENDGGALRWVYGEEPHDVYYADELSFKASEITDEVFEVTGEILVYGENPKIKEFSLHYIPGESGHYVFSGLRTADINGVLASGEYYTDTDSETVAVYALPHRSTEKKDELRNRVKVNVKVSNSNWAYIEYGDENEPENGWVNINYLSEQKNGNGNGGYNRRGRGSGGIVDDAIDFGAEIAGRIFRRIF